MDIQKEREVLNTEFTETINLVKAVLERLEFHAFEEVLIWSEEHASKALLRCLKKTLSEFENGHLVLTSSYPKLKHFSVDSVTNGLMTALDQAQERQDNLNREINELKDQLAKAQVVPAEFEIGRLEDRIGQLLDERQDLYAQLDAEAVLEWISVENTTPKKNGDYIVCIDGEPCSAFFKWVNDHWKEFKVGVGITEGIHGWWHTHLNVTHWMPLPKPPKAQEPAND